VLSSRETPVVPDLQEMSSQSGLVGVGSSGIFSPELIKDAIVILTEGDPKARRPPSDTQNLPITNVYHCKPTMHRESLAITPAHPQGPDSKAVEL
jgi:hypothetical protein